ncbi:MAG: hypothetical protein B7Z78_03330 [Rhodospirillales bacterium 20-60-12]|nr:MAG: hypothetical protein B7Z78_03330 [Rhodospirillales bacterium 20-60-12]
MEFVLSYTSDNRINDITKYTSQLRRRNYDFLLDKTWPMPPIFFKLLLSFRGIVNPLCRYSGTSKWDYVLDCRKTIVDKAKNARVVCKRAYAVFGISMNIGFVVVKSN